MPINESDLMNEVVKSRLEGDDALMFYCCHILFTNSLPCCVTVQEIVYIADIGKPHQAQRSLEAIVTSAIAYVTLNDARLRTKITNVNLATAIAQGA